MEVGSSFCIGGVFSEKDYSGLVMINHFLFIYLLISCDFFSFFTAFQKLFQSWNDLKPYNR